MTTRHRLLVVDVGSALFLSVNVPPRPPTVMPLAAKVTVYPAEGGMTPPLPEKPGWMMKQSKHCYESYYTRRRGKNGSSSIN